MSRDDYTSLNEMYIALLEAEDSLKRELKRNLFRISEIDAYLQLLHDQEEEDFKVFSPRNVEEIHKESIAIQKEEKSKLEEENRSLYSKINKVTNFAKGLQRAMDADTSFNKLEILDIQEKERQRIARDLHDTSLQNLTHLVHKVELASIYMDRDVVQAKLELATLNKGIKEVIEDIRNTIFDLRPMSFDDLGLKEAFDRLFTVLKENNKTIDFETDIGTITCENESVRITIYRIVQEACSNAIEHSGGNKIKIQIAEEDKCCKIVVKDNGKGFTAEELSDKDNKNFGVAIMKERVKLLDGKISFDSVLGGGTEIKIEIPL
ncbi:MAG: sensor histidine kinase [Lachnospiraceae bacterium]|nr:sensor histidine kinase [Lachnospiraceae bacterium]